jgi:hypothetical protein
LTPEVLARADRGDPGNLAAAMAHAAGAGDGPKRRRMVAALAEGEGRGTGGRRQAPMNAATKLPLEMGPIHFVGIGGIGMSGIAEVLLNHGYRCRAPTCGLPITERLATLGARIFDRPAGREPRGRRGRRDLHRDQAGNPELEAARARGLPVVRRAEMLAELMRLRRTSRSPAPTARPPPRRWWPRCWMPAGSTRR